MIKNTQIFFIIIERLYSSLCYWQNSPISFLNQSSFLPLPSSPSLLLSLFPVYLPPSPPLSLPSSLPFSSFPFLSVNIITFFLSDEIGMELFSCVKKLIFLSRLPRIMNEEVRSICTYLNYSFICFIAPCWKLGSWVVH